MTRFFLWFIGLLTSIYTSNLTDQTWRLLADFKCVCDHHTLLLFILISLYKSTNGWVLFASFAYSTVVVFLLLLYMSWDSFHTFLSSLSLFYYYIFIMIYISFLFLFFFASEYLHNGERRGNSIKFFFFIN